MPDASREAQSTNGSGMARTLERYTCGRTKEVSGDEFEATEDVHESDRCARASDRSRGDILTSLGHGLEL